MTQVINTQASESALDAKRHEVVATIMRGYGASKEYAELLFQYFPEDWYSFEHNDKDEAAKGILAEAQKFRDELRKAGHSNPSVAWTRVRQEGAMLAGLGDKSEEGEEGEEGDKAGAKQVRGLTLRLVEDLGTLHKACKREEAKNNLDAKQAQASIHIAQALQALGVDLTMVK